MGWLSGISSNPNSWPSNSKHSGQASGEAVQISDDTTPLCSSAIAPASRELLIISVRAVRSASTLEYPSTASIKPSLILRISQPSFTPSNRTSLQVDLSPSDIVVQRLSPLTFIIESIRGSNKLKLGKNISPQGLDKFY